MNSNFELLTETPFGTAIPQSRCERDETLPRNSRKVRTSRRNSSGHAATRPTLASDAPMAVVYRPARNPMQSGPRTNRWVVYLQPKRPLHLEPLMGWTSGDDPSRHVRIEFASRKAAVEYANARGWEVCELPENRRQTVVKSYRDQFVDKDANRAKAAGPIGKVSPAAARQSNTCEVATEPQHEASKHADQDWLDDALAATFPASDPVALWAGHIGPPASVSQMTA